MRLNILLALLGASLAVPAAAQVTARPNTVEEFIRLYGGEAAARSYAAAEKLAPYQSLVTLTEGCGARCSVAALVVEARPRTDAGSRQLCFGNPLPTRAAIDGAAVDGFVTHAEATITTNAGEAVLAYRLFARLDPKSASSAKPTLKGDWCATLPAALREAAAANGWSVALRAIPPRDARYTYVDLAEARLAPRPPTGVQPPRFNTESPAFVEAMIRTPKPGARLVINGRKTKLRTPATLSVTEAAAVRVQAQQGKKVARLDTCTSQWSPDHMAFVFDCTI